MKNTVRLNFEFPREHYPYLKMVCAKKGLSLKDFATELLVKEIEEYEDILLANQADERLKEIDVSENISIEKAMEEAGWDDVEEV